MGQIDTEVLVIGGGVLGTAVMLSSPTLFPAVFGANAGNILKSLFCHRHSLFSFQHCYFIKVNDRNAGMVLSYDWQTAKREPFNTGLLLLNQRLDVLPCAPRYNFVLSCSGEKPSLYLVVLPCPIVV